MCDQSNSGGIISEEELAGLTSLFIQFEGASDPLSNQCKEAQFMFNARVEKIFEEKVKPRYAALTLSLFRSAVRKECRLRASKQGPPFPCI